MFGKVIFKGILRQEDDPNEEFDIAIQIPKKRFGRLAGLGESEEVDRDFIIALATIIRTSMHFFLKYIDLALTPSNVSVTRAMDILDRHIVKAAKQLEQEQTQKTLKDLGSGGDSDSGSDMVN